MKKLIAAVLGIAAASAMADVTLDGPTFISSNTTVGEKVTGSGYYVITDGATLTLAGADNDFTGGVIISNGVLEATASGAFGTGPISLEGTATTRMVKLNVDKGVFANAITIKDATTSKSYPVIYLAKSATLNADIVLDQGMANASEACIYIQAGVNEKATSTKLTINGRVLAGVGRVQVVGWGQVAFKDKVTCGNMYLGDRFSEHGTVELWSSENEIARLVQFHFNISCMADNAINKTSYQMNFNKEWQHAGYCTTSLSGHDIHCQYLTVGGSCDVDFSASEKWGEMIYNGNGYRPATVLFDAEGVKSASGRCCTRFYGNINLKMENRMLPDGGSVGTYYQSFEGRDNGGMVGNISIGNKCNFRVLNGCRFGGVTNLTVESGGWITYEKRKDKTTPIGNTFTGLQDLYLKGTAFIRSETSELVNPVKSPKCLLHMDTDSRIYLREGQEMTVKKLFVNGELMPAGTYTKDNLPQMCHASQAGTYTGKLIVLKGVTGLILNVR